MRIQAEANLAALIESTEDLIWSVDPRYRLITFNRALKKHIEANFGGPVAPGMGLAELLPPANAALWHPLYDRALRGEKFRTELPLSDGRVVELAFNPIVVDGEMTGVSVFGKDITERKKAESALREAEKKYRDIFDGAIEGFYETTPDGKSLIANPALAKMLGYDSPDDLVSTIKDTSRDLWVDKDERASFMRLLEEQGIIRGYECRFKRKNGAPIWVSLNVRRVCGADGCVLHLEGFIREITERKQVEMQLHDSQERYHSTFEQAAVGIVHASFEGRYLRCNGRFAELVGYAPEEIPGMAIREMTAPEDYSRTREVEERILSGATSSESLEKRYLRKDGSLTWAKLTISIQRDGGGRALHFIAVVEDINTRKAAEEHMAAAQEALLQSEERYRTAFQMSSDSIDICQLEDGRFIDVNDAFLKNMGYQREEVLGRTALEIGIWANPGDRKGLVETIQREGVCRNMEVPYYTKDGNLHWGLLSVSVIELDGLPCILSVTRDITEAKAAEQRLAQAAEALRLSEERYRTVFHTSLDCIAISRLSDGRYIDVNKAFLDLIGVELEEVVGRTSTALGIWAHPDTRREIAEILRRDSSLRDYQTEFVKKNGEIFWVLLSASVIEIEGVSCIVSFVRDISGAKAAENTIQSLAFYDPLTGLPNRRMLLDRLRQTLAGGAPGNRLKALLLVDLDDLKTLNDTLGHQMGDLLLQEVARRMAACAREDDTVGRLGGDEFILILEDLSEVPEEAATQAKAASEIILASIGQPCLLKNQEWLSAASMGITVFGDRPGSADEILQQADIALHLAKAAGRNTLRFFSPALQAAVNARATLEGDLRLAIKTQQFLLYYQPQVDRGRMTGVEALIRWQHPSRGLVPPDEFIPLAEESRLILPVGDWVLETACAQLAAWAARSETEHLTVSVNISALQFRQPEFVEHVLAALDHTGANPKNLKLELTESLLVDNFEEVITKMTELNSHGLSFSLDDFGTGYSSLAYLKRLPLDQLKIDRTFVRDMLVDLTSGAIAQTIISLGRAMDMSVMAEGVETEEQRGFLAGLGCHSFQGYLFSRPLPLEELEALIEELA